MRSLITQDDSGESSIFGEEEALVIVGEKNLGTCV